MKFTNFLLYRVRGGKYPGSVYVAPLDKNGWYARIETNGSLTLNKSNILPGLEDDLLVLAANPSAIAGSYGKIHGNCCFCSLPLTDERSLSVGYGATCSQHYGLFYPTKQSKK